MHPDKGSGAKAPGVVLQVLDGVVAVHPEVTPRNDARAGGSGVTPGDLSHPIRRAGYTPNAVRASVAATNGARTCSIDEKWIVVDAGTVVSRERARSQMEGAVILGMRIAFHGAVTMRGAAVVQTNFRDYPVTRMADAPRRIHVDMIASDAPPGGVGEQGVPPVAPAITNAIFDPTGTRLRELPIRI